MKVFQVGIPLFIFVRKEFNEMTIDEASQKYNIPIKILKEYENWGLCQEVKKSWVPGIMMIVILNV